ncbi:MAG TPA: hypothetical protein V6D29_23810 [Leptolyngbyaceae cyanobacterium]
MKSRTSSCSLCRHYTPEGRRGGHCGQLGVSVQGRWQACSLAVPVFMKPMPALEVLEKIPQPIEVHMPDTRIERLEPVRVRALT